MHDAEQVGIRDLQAEAVPLDLEDLLLDDLGRNAALVVGKQESGDLTTLGLLLDEARDLGLA